MSVDSRTMTGPPPIPYVAVSPPPFTDANGVAATGRDLAPLVWKGLLLTVVTLGIYRFWYKTDLRRWYWRNTLVGGSTLEYRGTAKELFVGFLFALAIMVPIYVMIAFLGLIADGAAGVGLQAIVAPFFLILIQYGAYRSRRYRLTRTVWRGIRFNQTGSPWAYAFRSFGWILLTVVTLGIVFPFMRRALEHYRITNTTFGSAVGVFDAPIGPVMKRWLILLGLPLISIIICIIIVIASLIQFGDEKIPRWLVVYLPWLPWITILVSIGLWPWYRAGEFRTFTNGTGLESIRLGSAFPTKSLYGLYLKYFGVLLIGLLAILAIIAVALIPLFQSGRPPQDIALTASIVLTPFYLLLFLGGAALKEIILTQGIWRNSINTMTISNLEALEQIIGSGVLPEAATGEGLADALDFGGV